MALAVMLPLKILAQTTNIYLTPSNPPPSVQLAWNADASPFVTNYFIYVGTNSGLYTLKIATGTNLTLTVTNLTRGVTSYFNVTAQGLGLESGFGGEISYTPASPPAPPPGFKPIVILTVQAAPSLDPSEEWTTLATLSLEGDQASGYFRTVIGDARWPNPLP